jgi:uncharacterized membrane protein YhhN
MLVDGPPPPHVDPLILGAGLILSTVLGLTYGLVMLRRPPGAVRTVTKVGAVGCLLLAACFALPPSQTLVAGIALSALGDGFLAGSRRWLPFGLASFLAAHIAYVVLFLTATHYGFALRDLQVVPMLGLVALPWLLGLAMLAWLWKDLGGLRWAVVAYVVAIAAMVSASVVLLVSPFMLGLRALCPFGAAMFMASDMLLSVQLFKPQARWAQGRAAGIAIWFLYLGGQWAIAAPFLGITA